MLSKEIKARFRKLWPDIRNLWLLDPEFDLPEKEEIESFLNQWMEEVRPTLPDVKNQSECDDRAFVFLGDLKRHQITSGLGKNSWAAGIAVCKKYLGVKAVHVLNIIVCSNKQVWLVEPDVGAMFVADPKDTEVFFIIMA